MKKLACLLLGLVLYSCAIENNGETDKLENEKATFELLDFTEVPSNIKDIVSGTSKALRERKPTDKDSGEFGAIIEASVHKVSRENGEAYYTFAMERTSDNLVDMDNMVITRDSLGNFSGNIVRYEQREGEYSADYSRYTGKVKIYDGQGALIVASDLENGRPVADKQGNESGKGSNTCILIDIIEAGVEIDGQFYRTEPLRYVYDCTEDGFEGEEGAGSSNGDSNPDPEEGGNPKSVTIVPNTTCQPGYTKDKNGNCVIEKLYPSCETFEYVYNGTSKLWITASVTGVYDVAAKLDLFPNVVIASYAQPLYFQLPGYWMTRSDKEEKSALMLWVAFENWGAWYRRTYRNAPATPSGWDPNLRRQLLIEIQKQFQKVGGRVSIDAPLGFTGRSAPYKEAGTSGYICD